MKRLFDYYQQQFKVTLAVQLQYRVGLMIWMIDEVLQPTIYLVVWQTTAGDGEIGGYTASAFAAYFIIAMIVDHFRTSWDMWEFGRFVRTGGLSPLLLRPFHPIHSYVSSNIMFKLLMIVVLIPAIVFMVVIFRPVLNPPLWAALAFVPALILAGALAFLLGWIVALAAFWVTQMTAINNLYFLLVLFCSGRLAPLDALPSALQAVASLLPFRWVLGFPVELLMGRLTGQETILGLGIQIAWLAVTIALFNLIWRVGVRQYGAVGG